MFLVDPSNLKINSANVDFTPTKISLTNFEAITGTSDLNATGTIRNFLGFILSEKVKALKPSLIYQELITP